MEVAERVPTAEPAPQPPTAGARRLAELEAARGASGRNRVWNRFVRYRPGLFGLGFIALLVLCAVAAPLLAPHSPYAVETSLRGEAPSAEYPLGNDPIG